MIDLATLLDLFLLPGLPLLALLLAATACRLGWRHHVNAKRAARRQAWTQFHTWASTSDVDPGDTPPPYRDGR